MRPSLFLLAALASLPGTLSAQSGTISTGSVIGHLLCADTHTPCRFASVTMETAPPAKEVGSVAAAFTSHAYAASTDLDGVFHMTNVIPGDYYILARFPGYLSAYDLAVSEFQEDSPLRSKAIEAALPRVTVVSGLTTASELSLTLGASLSGTVRFDDGGIASFIPIHLFRKDGSGNWKPFLNRSADSFMAALGAGSHTDSRGRMNELGLPPGDYTIEVTLPGASAVSPSITGIPSVTYTVTSGDALQIFNGDKYRLRDAIPIQLHEGEDRSGIDIDIPTNGLHSIHGLVTAKSNGRGITHGVVRLLDPEDKTTLRETSILNDDGSFVFNYVVSGSYLLQIEARAANTEAKGSPGYEPLTTPLLVEGDVLDLAYALAPVKR
jgi:hypothetical protein